MSEKKIILQCPRSNLLKMLRRTVSCVSAGPPTLTLIHCWLESRIKGRPELVQFQEVRRTDMDVWKQVTPEARCVTVLQHIGHTLAKGHGKRERLNLACHPALCELCVMENIQGHWAHSHIAVDEGCCRCMKDSWPTVFTSLMRISTSSHYCSLYIQKSTMMKNIQLKKVCFSLTVV